MKITKESPVTALSGCGSKRAELLAVLGINTVGDLLRHFPRGYQDRGNIRRLCDDSVGETGAFVLTVGSEPRTVRISGGRTITKCKAFEDDKTCTLNFFNKDYLKNILIPGCTYRLYGKLTRSRSGYELSPTVIEQIRDGVKLCDLVPIYPLTKGISQNVMRSIISGALRSVEIAPESDVLSAEIREKLSVCSEKEALECIHDPRTEERLKKGRDRFVAEELFLFACSVSMAKMGRTRVNGKSFDYEKCKLYDFTAALPYTLTKAQAKVISEIRRDIVGQYPMARLVSGDVGSGKTVCAMAAAYMAIKNGYQCAMMAPTEILVMQHYRDFCEIFGKLGIACGYLTGSVPAAQKRKTLERLASGELKMVVGTHALLSDKVNFNELGLVITDEQHRFGVAQRSGLQDKAAFPHVLVMSATPIPRTLALILLGDLDISVIDELPPGRQTVDTLVVGEAHRDRLNRFIEKQVESGRQVYIVCPSVENTEEEEIGGDIITFDFDHYGEPLPKLKSAIDLEEELRTKIFPTLKTAFVHGKMSGKDKERIMKSFAEGEIDILVSTTVIEVGVNVPNATLMIVENADRFGLSQLHQLRGRVGRGSEKSYCVLVSDAKGENARKRLEIMRTVKDGYKIAQQDLEIRGPGDFISPSQSGDSGSARQHGAFDFKLAGFCTDALLLERIFKIAGEIIEADPLLKSPENANLSRAVITSAEMGTRGVN